jgi:hypothetical protein
MPEAWQPPANFYHASGMYDSMFYGARIAPTGASLHPGGIPENTRGSRSNHGSRIAIESADPGGVEDATLIRARVINTCPMEMQ